MSKPRAVRALLIVDVQNDFIDGSLAVPDAASIIPVINKLRSKCFDYIYVCLDWHPFNHCSFRTDNPGSQLFQVIPLPVTGNAQVMWPDHCVQGTTGAELHKDLLIEPSDIWTRAGCNPQRDSYSVFKDNGSSVPTDMRDLVQEKGVTEIYAVGLATDFCVQYTLLDARMLLHNVEVYYVEDGCRGISDEGVKGALKAFEFEKVNVIRSDSPEIESLGDRKMNLHGQLVFGRSSDTAQRDTYEPVDDLYEAIVFKFPEAEIMEHLQKVKTLGLINKLCSWSGKNTLHACCELGDIEMLKKLVAIPGLDIARQTQKKENALMKVIALSDGKTRSDMIDILFRTADAEAKEVLIYEHTKDAKLTPLMFACQNGSYEAVEKILEIDNSLEHLKLQAAFGTTALMYASMDNTQAHAAIVELILTSYDGIRERLALLHQVDTEKWNCLHFGAKSGCFAGVDWSRAMGGYDNIPLLPINEITNSGISFLHLASWNGQSDVIRTILESSQPNLKKKKRKEQILRAVGFRKTLKQQLEVNVPVRATTDTELDLALQRDHLECARLLLRLGCHAGTSPTSAMHKLLHRLVLMGDVEACETILNFADENNIHIDAGLVEITERMEHPETCTFSFANYTHPVQQHLFECEYCGNSVCLVCKDRCHGLHRCRSTFTKLDVEHFPEKGWKSQGIVNNHCECARDHCCASAALDERESTGYGYMPNPVNTAGTKLSPILNNLSRKIARNMHNVWALPLYQDGWRFGKEKDSEKKLHPHLLPYDSLSYEARKYNLDMAIQTLKLILELGYKLVDTGEKSGQAREVMKQTAKFSFGETELGSSPFEKFSQIAWNPEKPECLPTDTSTVTLPASLEPLVQVVSSNSHEVWAMEKIKQGWGYAPSRNIKPGLKLNSSLVPFDALAEKEKTSLRDGATQTLKLIQLFGFVIDLDEAELEDKTDEEGETVRLPKRLKALREAMENVKSQNLTTAAGPLKRDVAPRYLNQARRRLFNHYLFAAVRRGHIESVNILLSKRASMHLGANLNATDKFGHTPLYVAIKRGHKETAKRLLSLGANVEIRDINGLTPLAIAAYLGNLELCQELVQKSSQLLVADNMGFTALHHAAHEGHLEVCRYLTERLQQEHQSNYIVNLHPSVFDADGCIDLNGFHQTQDKSRKRLTFASLGQLVNTFKARRQSLSRDKGKISPIDMGAVQNIAEGKMWFDKPSAEAMTQDSVWSEDDRGGACSLAQKLASFSPLSLAVLANNIEIAEMLINNGANPMIEDGDKEDSTLYSPYVRALYRHIELDGKVEILKDQIAKRAYQDLESQTQGARVNETEKLTKFFGTGVNPNTHFAHGEMNIHTDGTVHQQDGKEKGVGGNLQNLLKRADSRLTDFFGFDSKSAQQLSKKKTMRELDEMHEKAIADRDAAMKMVEVLNMSSKVRAWREKYAVRLFIKETSGLILILLCFACLVQLAPDYDLAIERVWTSEVTQYMQAKTTHIQDASDFIEWLDKDFILKDLWRGSTTTQNVTHFMKHNLILGAIDFRRYDNPGLARHFDTNQADSTELDLDDDTYSARIQLVTHDLNMLAQQLETNTSSWQMDQIQMLSLSINIYNPYYQVYGICDVSLTNQFYGNTVLMVNFLPFRVGYGRFPPSVFFQVAVALMVCTFSLTRLRSWLASRRRKSSTIKHAEYVSAILLLMMLVLDIYIHAISHDITPDYHSYEYRDYHFVQNMILTERRVFAVFFIISMVPLLSASRTMPSVGPVVVALLNTMTHSAVLIYLMVVAVACFLLTMTFYVGFAGEVAVFSSVVSTFDALFQTPFIEAWDTMATVGAGSKLGTVLGLFYIIFATITLNLLIAIVSDIYPQSREQSDFLWEKIITEGIEQFLKASISQKRTTRATLSIKYWTRYVLLRGKDGVKHWDASKQNDSDVAEDFDPVATEISQLREQLEQITKVLQNMTSVSNDN